MASKSRSVYHKRPARERATRAIWGVMAALSAAAVAVSAVSEDGQQRVAALFAPDEPQVAEFASVDEIERLSAEIARLKSETRFLALEKQALTIKLSSLETEWGPLTASIPDPSDISSDGLLTAPVGPDRADAVTPDGLTPDDPAAGPRQVRTIDVGFVPLPLDEARIDDALAPPEDEILAEISALAHPLARRFPSQVVRTRFAIEVGAEPTMDAARERWTALRLAHGPLLGGLDPAVAIAEGGEALQLRLLAGPFIDAADAITTCAALLEQDIDCRAVRSEGQKLVMR